MHVRAISCACSQVSANALVCLPSYFVLNVFAQHILVAKVQTIGDDCQRDLVSVVRNQTGLRSQCVEAENPPLIEDYQCFLALPVRENGKQQHAK